MVTEDQSEVIALLESPATHAGAPVERIETHASMVFLAGERAWKLKRAVRYDYLDFSTATLRGQMCEAEVRLNRRTAPALYLGVTPIARAPDGSLALGGAGPPVDWVVEMRRFDQGGLFDRLAANGRLGLELMPPLAAAIASLHAAAERRPDRGGRAGMQWVIDGNEEGFALEGRGILDPSACARLISDSRAALDRHGPVLDERRAGGFVRYCHGDLHLRNIVLLDGRPTLFDAIEFNEQISCIDVLYDLAFLLMDLWRRQLPRHANLVWNAYLGERADDAGAELLPLFLSCRAAVRAKTSATSANLQADSRRADDLRNLARQYLELAADLLKPPPPVLIAIGGLSGSGKSSLAQAIAPRVGGPPGALVLRSDVIRKRLSGVSELTRLGPKGYTDEMSRRVYETMAATAARGLRAGQAVIVDAVFAREADRLAVERVATSSQVPFAGLWLHAPPHVLLERADQRRTDASDANAAVVRQQLAQGIGTIAWQHLDAASDPARVLKDAADALARHVLVRPAYAQEPFQEGAPP